MRLLFADTGYWIALFNPRDYLHTKAIAISQVTQNCGSPSMMGRTAYIVTNSKKMGYDGLIIYC